MGLYTSGHRLVAGKHVDDFLIIVGIAPSSHLRRRVTLHTHWFRNVFGVDEKCKQTHSQIARTVVQYIESTQRSVVSIDQRRTGRILPNGM